MTKDQGFITSHPILLNKALRRPAFNHFCYLTCTLKTSSSRNGETRTETRQMKEIPSLSSDPQKFLRSPQSILFSPLVGLLAGASWISETLRATSTVISDRTVAIEDRMYRRDMAIALKKEKIYFSSALKATNARIRNIQDKLDAERTQLQNVQSELRQRTFSSKELQNAIEKKTKISEQLESLQSDLSESQRLCTIEGDIVTYLVEDLSRRREHLERLRADVTNARQRLKRAEDRVMKCSKKQDLKSFVKV